ncbi:bacillithiol system redox-active protein YtxJ [Fulvivirga sedimenti]|uniref:Bacillithiol system redox-active protein YtxJ n=1 Tax=Fulvivirga sedimenti TaxID=2879465 RepID=A0A9X1HYN5_9BACT|nr:bacillithiol system redox-active protein YtxJ [Fulvivirga sedimenti]MCA6079012.1 bacillithiol system redox-active protein YtxJ [Fulvivirga sedimenti]
MHWNTINSVVQIGEILEKSHTQPIVIFKHSYRCGISSMAFDRLKRYWNAEEMEHVEAYTIDVIGDREVSYAIADELGVRHESPQLLVVKNGQVVYHDSHMGIQYDPLKAAVQG